MVYSRFEHLPSHVHICVGNGKQDLGKISLYPTVEIIDPNSCRIPQGDRAGLLEFIKTHKKMLQKEWNKLNGKPVPDERNKGGQTVQRDNILENTSEEEYPQDGIRIWDITSDGFWIHVYDKDFYISREKYPWFKDATNEEIKKVGFLDTLDENHHGLLIWLALDLDFDQESLENPELIYYAINVRRVKRLDLFPMHPQPSRNQIKAVKRQRERQLKENELRKQEESAQSEKEDFNDK